MESKESQILINLNEQYLNIYYSKEYQKVLKLKKIADLLKKREIGKLLHIIYGRLIVKSLISKKRDSDKNVKLEKNLVRNTKIAVYTCITGNYDSLKEPMYINQNIDYYVFTDMKIPAESAWKKIDIKNNHELKDLSNADINRYIKICAHKFLPQYEYSIYVDGCIQIVADMKPIIEYMGNCVLGVHYHSLRNCIYKEANGIIYAGRAGKSEVKSQIRKYREEGYPKENGLYENTIIVRKHNDIKCIKLMNEWWKEYSCTLSKRDQISLPYIIWKIEFPKELICILGNDLNKNPRFRKIDADKHWRR